jgi:hypothetical protein
MPAHWVERSETQLRSYMDGVALISDIALTLGVGVVTDFASMRDWR